MKNYLASIIVLLESVFASAQPPLIHSHNDYQQAEPLTNALRNKVYSIEADVYLLNGELRVCHDKKDLPMAPSLLSLYIQPIIDSFRANKGHLTADKNYSLALMIDIKESGQVALASLVKLLSSYQSVFDKSVNTSAAQVVISGDRGDPSTWPSSPSFILFDGRPNEHYDGQILNKVSFISDSYLNYTRKQDSIDASIKQTVEKIHAMKKLVRLWAIPDNPPGWVHVRGLGVDIINTDRVSECRAQFSSQSQEN